MRARARRSSMIEQKSGLRRTRWSGSDYDVFVRSLTRIPQE